MGAFPELDDVCARAVRKAAWRLIPLLCVAYIVSYIDRTNVGFAALTMNAELGLSPSQFGFAAGMFFVGYCLFELPSNMALQRFGARRWLARIMITWGIMAAATGFAVGPISYNIIRFVTGVAEAGFYPGAIFYIATWFPLAVRGRLLGWFVVAVPLSSVISGPVSAGLLQMDRMAGLSGWQWLFLLEGVPACILGVITLCLLVDKPEDAKWLTSDEKMALRKELDAEQHPGLKKDLWPALKDPRVLVLSLAYFFFVTGSIGVNIWLPQILKPYGLSTMEIGLISSVPYVIGAIALILWSYLLDRSREYLKNYVIGCFVAGAGFLLSVIFDSLWPAVAGVSVALIGMSGARPAIFCLPPRFLTGAAAAGSIALINSFGNLGGFMGPYVIGWLRETTGSFSAGLYFLAGSLALSAIIALSIRAFDVRQ